MDICIFGASSSLIDRHYTEVTEVLAAALARRGHSLIYGAGVNGLMGASARGFHKAGGRVTGVVPRFFKDGYAEQLYDGCDEFVWTETMAERKTKMEELADAFIVVPGGIGTYEEFFEVLVLRQLGRHNKNIAVYDINNYFAPLNALLERSAAEKFLAEEARALYRCFKEDETSALISYIEETGRPETEVSRVKYG